MVDVKSRRCSEQNCDKYPAFNYPDETLSKFCGIHRKDGMIDVHNKRCLIDNCNTRPSFNMPGAHSRRMLQGLTLQAQVASLAWSAAALAQSCWTCSSAATAHLAGFDVPSPGCMTGMVSTSTGLLDLHSSSNSTVAEAGHPLISWNSAHHPARAAAHIVVPQLWTCAGCPQGCPPSTAASTSRKAWSTHACASARLQAAMHTPPSRMWTPSTPQPAQPTSWTTWCM